MINWDKFDTEKYFQKIYAAAKAIDDQKVRVMPVVTARGAPLDALFATLFSGTILTDIEVQAIY